MGGRFILMVVWSSGIGGKKSECRGDVQQSAHNKSVYTPNNALIGFLAFFEIRLLGIGLGVKSMGMLDW